MNQTQILTVVDSHTEGEPTRVVTDCGFSLSGDTLSAKRDSLRQNHDWLRTACLHEPRGHDAMVGALLCESDRDDCVTGVVFFNNVGYLNGCIHGTIGVVQTLRHLGRISIGVHGIETPVGRVTATINENGFIAVQNIRSYRHASSVRLKLPNYGEIEGDIAWGGNWFFITENKSGVPIVVDHAQRLTDFATAIRRQLQEHNITGRDGGEIDHLEVFEDLNGADTSDCRNFVLCPGGAYDRSPCGTGTSARMACLYAEGKLNPGDIWRQAGILGTVFEGSVEMCDEEGVIPTVAGRAFVNGELRIILNADDPFRFGIFVP